MPVWYALETGVESKIDPETTYLSSFSMIGYPRQIHFRGIDSEEGTQKEKLLHMLTLLHENEGLVKKLQLGPETMEWMPERIEFVKENGVKVYGAVITGPTKELLKLKDLPEITFASLGEVELWNWMDRPAQGRWY